MLAELGLEFGSGFDIRLIVAGMVFLAALATILAFGFQFLRSDRLESRLKAVRERRRELIQAQRTSFQAKSRLQVAPETGIKGFFLKNLKLQNVLDAKKLRTRLARAGRRSPSAVGNYMFWRVTSPILVTALSLGYVTFIASDKMSLGVRSLIVVGALIFGYFLPQILLTNAIQGRQKILQRAFPDTLDLIVICVEAGMSVEAAFNKVTEQMAESSPQMAEEMGLTSAELAFLGDRRLAFENMSDRTGLPGMKSLASTLLQAEKYGTPIAVGLRVLAQENRDYRMSLAEKKAAALPAKLTVPMIVFFLPVLFMVIAGPAGIRVANTLN